jgi:hypothetical protein
VNIISAVIYRGINNAAQKPLTVSTVYPSPVKRRTKEIIE